MKKIMILAAIAAFAVGCGSDDNGSSVSGVNGTYKLTSLTSSQAHDGNGDGTATTNLIAEAGCFDQSTIVFGASNTASNTLVFPGFDGNACTPATANGTYVQNGSNIALTVVYDGETDTQNFVESGNTITATVPDFYEIEVTVNGETTYESIDAVMVYTKQ